MDEIKNLRFFTPVQRKAGLRFHSVALCYTKMKNICSVENKNGRD